MTEPVAREEEAAKPNAAPGHPGRPRVICHMLASVDGRIVTDDWALSDAEHAEHERVHEAYAADGWLVGRVTLERHFAAGTRSDAEVARDYDGPPRKDFVAPGAVPGVAGVHASFAFAVDARGKLRWESGDVGGDHLVALLTERVSDDYLQELRERGVSYLLAGRDALDLAVALDKIGARLGVRTLMLEGGGGINGSMLRAGLIDEVSLLVAPVADGRVGTATLFDIAGDGAPARLTLAAVERRAGDLVWLRYVVASHLSN